MEMSRPQMVSLVKNEMCALAIPLALMLEGFKVLHSVKAGLSDLTPLTHHLPHLSGQDLL